MSFDQLVAEIKKLTPDEQVHLVDYLSEELRGSNDSQLVSEHIAIVEERMRNAIHFVSGDEVLSRVRARVPK